MAGLAERLVQTRQQISEECARLQRSEPMLIVVTKNHSIDLAEDLYDLGERDFGENRVQEALPKFQQFTESGTRLDARWHLIGQLQTNKVKSALDFASSIHSLDRLSLLNELIKRTEVREMPLDVFIQVNLTRDPGRGGIELNEVMQFADQIVEAPKLQLKGLMAVASLENSAERDFEIVAKLSQRLVTEHPKANSLSIGMSGDYLEALSYGATHLRIGTAITGNR